ncbi:hypothetical protein ACJJU9_18910 [Pseudomonas helleri]|jgi:hypothetical protein|uniref:hypothetical protein n=1 Tax=Pseudomonas TaxID=286 RepID=UPI000A220F8F|nr:hypothetical protein [Pseudomonas syringae]OSR64932.1 hypothetical protein BV326_05520 [Pseudomonas syringae pv. actinidiae]
MTDETKKTEDLIHTFDEIVALKDAQQRQKQEDLREWRLRYEALDEETRKALDEKIKIYCDSISVQFGKSRPFHPRSR